jgi:hypothetical protein
VLTIELASSRYFKAFQELKDYPIVTQEMIEGGTFFEKYRADGTIVNGYFVTEEDISEEGTYYQEFRKSGDFVLIDEGYVVLSDNDVSASGAYYQSVYQRSI